VWVSRANHPSSARVLTRRLVYACQKKTEDSKHCHMFLWDDDAKPREERAFLYNKGTEPGRNFTASDPPRRDALDRTAPSGTKRKLPTDDGLKDEYDLGGSDQSFEDALQEAAIGVETPKRAKRIDSYMTPMKRNGQLEGLPTPKTDTRTFQETFSARISAARAPEDTPSKLTGPNSGTIRAIPFSANATPSSSPDADGGLSKELFAMLQERNVRLDDEVQSSLKQLLGKHSLRMQGVTRGRDVSRLTVKAKDAKIAELEHRVATLEAELAVERALVENLKWQAETGCDT